VYPHNPLLYIAIQLMSPSLIASLLRQLPNCPVPGNLGLATLGWQRSANQDPDIAALKDQLADASLKNKKPEEVIEVPIRCLIHAILEFTATSE
jgi:hypothetical protein